MESLLYSLVDQVVHVMIIAIKSCFMRAIEMKHAPWTDSHRIANDFFSFFGISFLVFSFIARS